MERPEIDLYLIRHAECLMNTRPELIGGRSDDSPLSDNGKLEAALLGDRLKYKKIKFDEVYSSTAIRAIQTANISCKKIGFKLEKIVESAALLELSQGDYEGKLRKDIHIPTVIAKMEKEHWDFSAPNGESQRQVEDRMYDEISEKLLLKYPVRLKVGIYTHGLAIKCLFRKIMNSDPRLTYKIEINNTSITRFKYNERGWNLITLNDTAHLYNK